MWFQVVSPTTRLFAVFIVVCCTNPGLSLTSFEIRPADSNGVLTACVGDHVSLMCSHDNDANGITRWIFSTPIDCSETIDHNPPIITRPCGPFTFQDITEIRPNILFNSTAVAIASTSMTGAVAECRDSSGDVYNQIGTASICIIDQPSDLVVINVNGAHVVLWDGTTCIGATITYRVEITRVNDSESTEVIMTSTTEATLPTLQPNIEYSVSVTAVASTCSSNPAITKFMSELEASAGSTQLAGVGIGVGVTAVVVSIAIIISVITVVLLFIKFRSRSTVQLIIGNKDVTEPDSNQQTIHKDLKEQLKQCNAYVSQKEMTRTKMIKEESSDSPPSLYAVTVLAAPEIIESNGMNKPKPLPRKEQQSPVNSLGSPSKAPPKPPRIRPGSTKAAHDQDEIENQAPTNQEE